MTPSLSPKAIWLFIKTPHNAVWFLRLFGSWMFIGYSAMLIDSHPLTLIDCSVEEIIPWKNGAETVGKGLKVLVIGI